MSPRVPLMTPSPWSWGMRSTYCETISIPNNFAAEVSPWAERPSLAATIWLKTVAQEQLKNLGSSGPASSSWECSTASRYLGTRWLSPASNRQTGSASSLLNRLPRLGFQTPFLVVPLRGLPESRMARTSLLPKESLARLGSEFPARFRG